MSTWSNASRKQEGRFSGSWLVTRLWVSLDVRPYLLLFGDTLIRPLFSFWWFISICSGPQAENSTVKVKKVGYYPTIDNGSIHSGSSGIEGALASTLNHDFNWKQLSEIILCIFRLMLSKFFWVTLIQKQQKYK